MSSEDLLDHFKLEAEVYPDRTIHISHRFNRSRERERIEKNWERLEIIGEGSFGQVWRELHRQPDGNHDVRAVKIIEKQRMWALQVDFKRELLALAKFSKDEVYEIKKSSKYFIMRLMFTWTSIEKPKSLFHFSAGSRPIEPYSLQWNTLKTAI
jgi:serine/threonine protein kinase